MAIRSNLQTDDDGQNGSPRDGPSSPGLWKLLVAAAAILGLLIAAMEVFKEPDDSMVRNPAQIIGH